MERQIKFRGKRIDRNEFVYGYLFEDITPTRHMSYIIKGQFLPGLTMPTSQYIEVIPETIGQFTGKIDSKRIQIFEGDKVIDGVASLYEVDYDKDNCSFFLSFDSGMDSCEMMEYSDEVLEIIGNIHTK